MGGQNSVPQQMANNQQMWTDQQNASNPGGGAGQNPLQILGNLPAGSVGQVNPATPLISSLENLFFGGGGLGQQFLTDPQGTFNQTFQQNPVPQYQGLPGIGGFGGPTAGTGQPQQFQGGLQNTQASPLGFQPTNAPPVPGSQGGQQQSPFAPPGGFGSQLPGTTPQFQLPGMGTQQPQIPGFETPDPISKPGQQFGGLFGGGSPFAQTLSQNPEMQAFQGAQDMLGAGSGAQGAIGGLLGGSAGNNVTDALQPVFKQNLNMGLNELTNRVPSTRNTGAAIEGTDLTRQALNDFNLLAAQAGEQASQRGLQGQLGALGAQNDMMGTMGALAGQAGQGQFGRQMGVAGLGQAGDLGFREQDISQLLGLTNASLGARGQDFTGRGQDINQLLGLGGLGVQQQIGLGNLGLGQGGLDLQNQGQQIGANQFENQFNMAGNQQAFNQQIAPAINLLLSMIPSLTGLQTVAAGR